MSGEPPGAPVSRLHLTRERLEKETWQATSPRPPGAPASRRPLLFSFLFSLLLSSCFEIPPELPDDPAPPGVRPPIAVYDRDPFDAKNRWFERAFRQVPSDSPRPRRPSSGPAEPLPSAGELEVVDRAELIALSEAALEEDVDWPDGCREQRARFIFHGDALALLTALQDRSEARGPSRLDRELLQALDPISRLPVDWPSIREDLTCLRVPPPPIRTGAWEQAPVELPPGLVPAAKDLRWTTVLRRETADGSRASALLRFRVAMDPHGEAILSAVPSECWILEHAEGEVRAAVWRFDRAASLAGREPWRLLVPYEELSIRDPLAESAEWLTGTTESLCLGCHGAGRERRGVTLVPATREAQLERVRGILTIEDSRAHSSE